MNTDMADIFRRTLNHRFHFTNTTDKAQQDHLIDTLKKLALVDLSCREDIVETIRAYADSVDPESKILIIDLIHAIISSSGGEYKDFFNEHIVDIFFSAYIHASKITRENLFEKREQWVSYFPKEVLKELDDAIRNVHPEYPVVPDRSELIAMHQERIELYHEIEALRKQRDELRAESSKQYHAVDELVPIEKPQLSTVKELKSTQMSDGKPSSKKGSTHSNERRAKISHPAIKTLALRPAKVEASLPEQKNSKDVTKLLLQPISGTSTNESLQKKSPKSLRCMPMLLADDNTSMMQNKKHSRVIAKASRIEPKDNESIDDSQKNSSSAKMAYGPALILHKDLHRFRSTASGDTSTSVIKRRSNAIAPRYKSNVMNSEAGPSMAGPSVKGPLAPLKSSRPKIAASKLGKSEAAPTNLLDTLLNDMNTLYGNKNPKISRELLKKAHQEERRKLVLKLTEHEREWDNVFFEPPRKITKTDKHFREITTGELWF